MRTMLSLLPVVVSVSMLLSCEQPDNLPKATTSSGGSSSGTSLPGTAVTFAPANWHPYVGDAGNQRNPNNYQQTLVIASSGSGLPVPGGSSSIGGLPSAARSYTVGMATSTMADTASYCYWTYSFRPPAALRVGRSLTLKVKVRLEKVQGKGVSLALRGDRGSQASVLFATTEQKMPLKGNADFTEYAVTLPYSTEVDYVLVYLVLLPNTTGLATFTDVSAAIN